MNPQQSSDPANNGQTPEAQAYNPQQSQPQQPPSQPLQQAAPSSSTYNQSAATQQPSYMSQSAQDSPNSNIGQPAGGPSLSSAGRSQKKRNVIIAAIIALLIVLLGTGFVFGYYLPNQPDNIYKSGMVRTGKAAEKLVNDGLSEEKIQSLNKAQVSGSIKVNTGGQDYNGVFNSKFDEDNSDSTLEYNGGENNLKLQLISQLNEGKLYPDIYFKLGGLSSMGIDQLLPQLMAYDDKWISASGDYLSSIVPADVENETKSDNNFTHEDARELVKIVNDKTREYVFTDDQSKAVVENRGFVGTEELEGDVKANHYTIGFNAENEKKYCVALVESVMSSEAFKKVPGVNIDEIDKDKAEAIKSCESSEEVTEEASNYDLWIDKNTKLVHKIKSSDKENANNYVEFGQNYKDGDVVPMFVNIHNDDAKIDAKIKFDIDMKQTILKGSVNAKYDSDTKADITSDFEIKPHEGDINIEIPDNAVPLKDVLNALGIDPSMFQDSGNREDAFMTDEEVLVD